MHGFLFFPRETVALHTRVFNAKTTAQARQQTLSIRRKDLREDCNSSNHGCDGDDDETPVSRHPAASGVLRGGEVAEKKEEEVVEGNTC